ncbi:MAG: 3-deoxy-8-phosphooctulonate synthase [Endomicrobiaceae bacterium]|jgi:2-dehydro-3-deoxyphosphooctonate aldolase (KDO 8-P synthase)|nr:3-deoxy-8-phosphooctulonate synthase [Endomicrobiaceae bacterium]
MNKIKITEKIIVSNDLPLSVIAGPCIIESKKQAFEIAKKLKDICAKLKVNFIFKASYDKANRSSIDSFRGPGLEKGLAILSEIKNTLKIPVLTDVHCSYDVKKVAEVVDIIQIPAFLCRQTDLIVACANTNLPINIKKGQFLAPEDTLQIIKKVNACKNNKLSLTERGSSFGYRNLVVDFRSIEIMKQFGCPVIFDATHSVQKPGGLGTSSGGDRQFVLPLAKAAVAVGVAALFVEVHPNPDKALSDGANSIDFKMFKDMMQEVVKIDKIIKRK